MLRARPEIVLQDLLGRQDLDTLSDEAGGQRGADVRGPVDQGQPRLLRARGLGGEISSKTWLKTMGFNGVSIHLRPESYAESVAFGRLGPLNPDLQPRRQLVIALKVVSGGSKTPKGIASVISGERRRCL